MHWVYLCSYPNMLALAKRWAPAGLELDPVNRTSHPERLDGVRYVDMDTIAESLPRRFRDYYFNPKARWALGLKMLIPMVFKPPFLYTDDDVIVVKPMDPLFNGTPFCECYGFDRWNVESNEAWADCEALSEIFEVDFDPYDFNEYSFNFGVYYAEEYPDWERYMHRFWESDWTDRFSRTSNRFRCLDQAFLRPYGMKMGWRPLKHVHEKRTYMQAIDKTKPTLDKIMKGYFVHYGASTHKPAYVELFNQLRDEYEHLNSAAVA